MENIPLYRGRWGDLLIEPRWPATKILIETGTLSALERSQRALPNDTQIIITRAFETPGSYLVKSRNISRCIGRCLFLLLYPGRRSELHEIFHHNGHQADGTHVDIAIKKSGRLLNKLPLGVLTPLFMIKMKNKHNAEALRRIQSVLINNGFIIHSNAIESLQIHCDFHKNLRQATA